MQPRPAIRSFPLTALALAMAAGSLAPPAALAQGERATELEEIVVTAQRREESLQKTPISITAFTEGKLTELGVFDVSQVADFAPNVTIQRQPSSNSNMGIKIRGVGEGETSLLADPKVGMYIDGVFMSKTVGGVFDVVDLERVEVLRGPQGTLFGRNTTGGAINVITRKPTGELGGKLEASMGNFGYMRYGGSIDLPAVGDFAAKLSINHMETDGWADNNYKGTPTAPLVAGDSVEDKLASEDNWAGRIALRWTPTESLTFDYSYDRTDNEGVPAPFQITKVKDSLYNGFTTTSVPFTILDGANGLYDQMAAVVGDPDERQDDFNLDSVTDEWLEIDGHNFTAAWQVSDALTFKYIFGRRETDSGYDSTDLDGGAYTAVDLFYGGGTRVQMPGFTAVIDTGTIETDTHELQVIGNLFDNKLFYTGGLFYYNEEVEQNNPQTFALPINFVVTSTASPLYPAYNAAFLCFPFPQPNNPNGVFCPGTQRLPLPFGAPGADPNLNGLNDFRYGQETDSWAAYFQGTFSITEQFDLTAGVRYTEDEKEAFLFNESAGHVTFADRLQADDKWDNISYMINGNYAFTDDLSVYLKYSTGYNGGGFNARASTAASFTTPFEEEEVEVWEIGLKSEWFGNRLRFNAAVFTNDYTDIQVAQFEAGSGGASSRIVNAGQGTYDGFEIELLAVPIDGLTLEANYGYLDAQFDEYEALNPVTNQLEDISDVTTVAQAPDNSANFAVQYEFEPSSIGVFSARVDVAYKDEFTFHPFNNQYDSAEDRTLVNGRLSLSEIPLGCCDKGGLRVSLWGKNLTDEEYRNWGIDFGALGFTGDVFGEPRTYGLDVTYQYR